MADQLYGVNAAKMARIVKAVRKSEREPPPPVNAGRRPKPSWSPWKAFKNTGATTIPAFGVVAITGREAPSEYAPYVLKGTLPSTTFCRDNRANSSIEVLPNEYGLCMSPGLDVEVLYDTAGGTPAFGESWGPKPSQTKLFKGYPGFTISGGTTTSGSNSRVWAAAELIDHLVGKADSNIAALSSATPGSGTVSVWYRTTGSTAYADSTINVTGKNFSAAVVTSAKFLQLKYFAEQWLVDFESCT